MSRFTIRPRLSRFPVVSVIPLSLAVWLALIAFLDLDTRAGTFAAIENSTRIPLDPIARTRLTATKYADAGANTGAAERSMPPATSADAGVAAFKDGRIGLAYRVLLPLSESGDTRAKFYIGLMQARNIVRPVLKYGYGLLYQHHRGGMNPLSGAAWDNVPTDDQNGVRLIEEAAAANHPTAMAYIGYPFRRWRGGHEAVAYRTGRVEKRRSALASRCGEPVRLCGRHGPGIEGKSDCSLGSSDGVSSAVGDRTKII